jgi:hypothetical protein
MPTVQQLPPAATVNATDELMLDQSGTSVSATIAQVLAATAPAVTLTGDVTGSGTGTVVTTIAPVATPGTFTKVTVNAKGQVTGGGAVAGADVVTALGFTPYSAANPAGYITGTGLAPVATAGTYASLIGAPTIGTLAGQNANAVAITGGSVGGVDLSASPVTATGSTTARTLAARAHDWLNVLDYGADPTGVADSAAAFLAAMNAVPAGTFGTVYVPAGSYRLSSYINEPYGRKVSMIFADGANITSGGLGVERIESKLGAFSLRQDGGGWFGYSPTPGSQPNLAFHTDIVQNTSSNSGAMRVTWARTYSNYNYYGKYVSGIDIAEQNVFSWPFIYDNSSGWGHWEVINGPTWDEDSAGRAHVSASAEHSEFDVSNNGPEAGWTFRSGQGLGVQGMSIDPWGQNGNYGGNILYAYGSVGSFDGQTGGLNDRWPSYPAVFSNGNPGAVAQNSTIVITFDLTAKCTASLSGGGTVNGVAISNGGGAYTSAPTVVFSGGGGSGAVAIPVMLAGSVVGVTVTSPGSGYTSPPTVSFSGGGVAAPSPVTVTLNTDGAHGDVASIAAAINAANIPSVRAAVHSWGGVVNRLVVFGVAISDLGVLTLAGTALGTLGMNSGATSTPRDTMVVVFGGTGGVAVGDKLSINGNVVIVGGAGAQSDVIAAINNAGILGVTADKNANGVLVLTAWLPQSPGGLVLAQVPGYTTLTKLGLNAGTFWPPTPPKGFATAYGELSSPICRTTDQIAISATDLYGGTYGPVTVTLNGGAGTGWPVDVVTSIQAAIYNAGWYSGGSGNVLSAPPNILIASARGSGGNQGVVLRNSAGGTLTLANVTGTPLQTLGLTPGTYKPGGYSAGSQSVFMAAEDSIAAQGRGIFIGGASNATDRTVWPNTPAEARGSFLHGIRTDKATFDDNNAILLGATQAIAFGTGSGSLALTNVGGTLQANGTALALSSSVPSHTSQLANDTGFIASSAIPAGAGTLLGGTAAAGAATTIALGANLTLAGGTLSAGGVTSFNGRGGLVSLSSADVTGALGYTPGSGGGTVASVVAGAGLSGGTINTTGTVSLSALPAGSLMGNAGTLAGVPGSVAVGAGITLSATGTLSNSGVVSFNSRTGALTLTSADVTGALGYTPGSGGGTVNSVVAGAGLAGGTISTSGTVSLGTLAPGSLMGNSGPLAAVPGAIAVGSGVTLAAGTLSNTGVVSFNSRMGALSLSSADVTGALTYTPANRAGDSFSGAVTLNAGGVLSGTLTNIGTISGGTLTGTMLNAGSLSGGALLPATLVIGTSSVDIATTTTIDTGGNAVIANSVGGSTAGQISWRLAAKAGYVQFADSGTTAPNAGGADAIDLQLDRGAASQVASGNRAVALGARNTSTGVRAVAIGYGNTAAGQGSVVLGQNATDNGTMGSVVFSAGYLGQSAGFQLGGASGAGTPVRLTADGSSAGAANVVNLPANQTLGGVLTVTARNIANGDVALWTVTTLYKNSAGTLSVISPGTAAIAPAAADTTLTAATLTVTADNTDSGLNVTVTPPTGVTVRASAVLQGAQIA